jgi:hypothetical protein
MSNMLKWAEAELKLAGYDINDPEDGPNRWLAEGTLELLKVFLEQGHSGMSAPFAIALFEKLASGTKLMGVFSKTNVTAQYSKKKTDKRIGVTAACSGNGSLILRLMMVNPLRAVIRAVIVE